MSDSNFFPHNRTQLTENASLRSLEWQIRSVQWNDLDALTDLLAISFHSREGTARLFYPLFKTALREDLRSRLQSSNPHYRCLVAVGSITQPSGAASILGTVEISLKPQFSLPWYDWFKPFPYISNLAIAPSQRRRGIAVDLLRSCEAIAQQWGHQDLYLHVLENNQAARSLYRKTGFRCQQADFSLSSILLGQPRQLLMHKRLPSPPWTPSRNNLE